MPLENEHSCRISNPKKYKRFTRDQMKSKTTGKNMDVLYGWYNKDGKEVSEIQAYRYPKERWGKAEARAHCERHDGSFEPAKEE